MELVLVSKKAGLHPGPKHLTSSAIGLVMRVGTCSGAPLEMNRYCRHAFPPAGKNPPALSVPSSEMLPDKPVDLGFLERANSSLVE